MERKTLSTFETDRIAEAMHIRHEAYLKDDEMFEVFGHMSDQEVYTQMILRNQDESFYYPVECRVNPKLADISTPANALDLLLDFQDYYFGRYLQEDRDIYLTIDWSEYEFDDKKIQAKGQIINRKLEQIADQWLGGTPPKQES